MFQTALLEVEETIHAVYQVSLSPSAPLGSVVSFRCELSSGAYHIYQEYHLATGIITEDFESGDFLNHNWQFGGNMPWEICGTDPFEGSYCSRSGTIADGNTSEMMITADVLADDTIGFHFKVSSEPQYDFLQFFIDNIKMGEWSGEMDWSYASYPVSTGEHTFHWIYSKDFYVTAGQDCAWVDYIVFPPIYNPVAVGESSVPAVMNIYPNPFTDLLTIEYQVQTSSLIGLSLFNASGQKILDVAGPSLVSPGTYTKSLDLSYLDPGVYYLRMDTQMGIVIRKIITLK
jgi:hypothetical protein